MDNAASTAPAEGDVTAANVDLSNCDREQIHIPGAIQPHGAMLVLDGSGTSILQASANTDSLLGSPPAAALLGQGVEAALGEEPARALRDLLDREGSRASLDAGPVHVARARLPGGAFDVFCHRADGVLVLEIERTGAEAPPPLDLYADMHAAIARLHAARGLREFLDLACAQIRRLTGYDRVMAYKFLEDGSGDVLAEAKAEGLEAYLGLRYPASDIPAPARRLFALSWLRHLPDAQYRPVPLLPETNPRTGRPIDLGRSLLRSVSVMYTDYLANMGTRGATVMPLMKEGRLWGLVSCHHATPRHVPYEARMAAEFLAHMLSLLMAAKEDAETYEHRLRAGAAIDRLVHAMANEPVFHHALVARDTNLLSCVEAEGAALAFDGDVVLLGETPGEERVRGIVAWLDARGGEEPVFATDRLPALWPEAEAFQDTGAGLLAARLVRHRPGYALWFRPEVARTVLWAGDPNKPMEVSVSGGEARLSPRGSFATYMQSVHGCSDPWSATDIQIAADLRRAVVEVILRQAEALEQTNRELAQSNLELDSFAYIASHDLKEPLRGIHNYAGLLLRSHGEQLGEDGRSRLETVLRLTRRMDDLIDGLLHYSRVGRADLAMEETDLDAVLDEALAALRPTIEATGTAIRRLRPLPAVLCDRLRMREVFTNLAANAVKYNDKPPGERWVEFGWEDGAAGDPPVFHVRDNGIGVAPEHHESIFQIFKRLHGRNDFGGGSGVGLTIVRRMVERHGGRLWIESEPGAGTAFRFTIGSMAGSA